MREVVASARDERWRPAQNGGGPTQDERGRGTDREGASRCNPLALGQRLEAKRLSQPLWV